ncbi:hypothetical protein [Nocardia puris]|uniref:Uncharacterized protein n=1 Tax=Nocardia puris TaxID=208602 RepID=A0A366DBZ7_9NOCA|nr:hypothetical protein [Nocardia puris]RBO87553.1 hypothetical protein DFR74_111260 [Nocardia puris]
MTSEKRRERHFELTDETTVQDGITLHRIRATRALPEHGVRAGDLGGWVAQAVNILGDYAWIDAEARVWGCAEIKGHALVCGRACVYDHALIDGNARVASHAHVRGYAIVRDNARVDGRAVVEDAAVVSEQARVLGYVAGNADVDGIAHLGPTAYVTSSQDVLTVSPLGSENSDATLYRTKDNGHILTVGCWSGRIGELAAEVKRRAEGWAAPEFATARWIAEYEALAALCRIRIAMWTPQPGQSGVAR